MILFLAKGLLFIALMETAFPSYSMCSSLESGEIVCYGVSKKKVNELMDESGMIDLEKLGGM